MYISRSKTISHLGRMLLGLLIVGPIICALLPQVVATLAIMYLSLIVVLIFGISLYIPEMVKLTKIGKKIHIKWKMITEPLPLLYGHSHPVEDVATVAEAIVSSY